MSDAATLSERIWHALQRRLPGLDQPPRLTKTVRGKPRGALVNGWRKRRDVSVSGARTDVPARPRRAHLKLKEISYIHAEGYASGELKHGPIALVDEHGARSSSMAPREDDLFDKTVSNMQEVMARRRKGGPDLRMPPALG